MTPGKIVTDLVVALALGGDCWLMSRCCAPSRNWPGQSPRIRWCPGWSQLWRRTRCGRCGCRPCPGCGGGCPRWPPMVRRGQPAIGVALRGRLGAGGARAAVIWCVPPGVGSGFACGAGTGQIPWGGGGPGEPAV